jgi:hypothetical protein
MSESERPAISVCGRCQRPIKWGRAYMPAIPFIGSWGGFWHQFCPPVLTTPPSPTDETGVGR